MAASGEYDPNAIERAWQERWEREGTYRARDDVPRERCYYVLEMFPYPSGKLHMGHVRNYSIGDAVARYQRMRGLHVLHPMGWDSFGLPAEEAAIKHGTHPKEWTYRNIDQMRAQLKRMGFSYDWSREFATSDLEYARREQELILDLVERGLVYRKSSTVNWSTGLQTVLANEQVVDGRCWRTDTPVVQKELPQWFLRTTEYADELLAAIDELDGWPEAVKTQQRNWIGRSEGAEIDFAVDGDPNATVTVFTTRPDTLFGVTFMSLAPEHELVERLTAPERRDRVEAFREEVAATPTEERVGDASEKKGIFTGAHVINPIDGSRVPVYVANFVLAGYGTGAVMAVPAHDQRDFDFARAHDLPVRRVILENGADPDASMAAAHTGAGTMVGSGDFDGMENEAAKAAIVDRLEVLGAGRRRATWRLRDWGISRQRYWGNPIPFVYGETMGAVPLAKKDLPVALPDEVELDGTGNPLGRHPTWATTAADGSPLTVEAKSGREPARRECDTMDTFVESSWYFARYCCHDNAGDDLGCAAPLDRERVDHWLPVDLYVGGIEHAVMHLLYARFFQKALADLGYASDREPFRRLLCQGMVVKETYSRPAEGGTRTYFSPDEVEVEHDERGAVSSARLRADGEAVTVGRIEKMSKSKNNGVDPQAIVDRYGADTARLFILSDVPPTKDLLWDEAAVGGCHRFLKRLWTFVNQHRDALAAAASYPGAAADLDAAADRDLLRQTHAALRRATRAMEEDFGFNVAIAEARKLFNECDPARQDAGVVRRAVETLLKVLAPITPHVTAELWSRLGHETQIVDAPWPEYDEAELVEETIEYPVQINGKVRARISLPAGLDRDGLEARVLEEDAVRDLVAGRKVRKLIAVPGRIVNIVAG